MSDEPKTGPHPGRIVSHGYGPTAEAAPDLPEGFDAESSGVGDSVPVVPDDTPQVEHPPADEAPTHAVISRPPDTARP